MQEFIALANSLADEAGEIIRKYYRTPFDVESKDDDSPVTIADRAVEKRLREIIEASRPEDGILGEEFGVKESQNGLTWVLDPIDGTTSFIIGRPTFGTLIALWEGDKPLLGIIDQAISGERWVGAEGRTTFNGNQVKIRSCPDLAQACVGSTCPEMFQNYPRLLESLENKTKMMAWGGDCYMYGLIASGFMDLCVESLMSPYDYLAHVPIVEGAGGKICDWDGKPLTLKSGDRVVALGDPALWNEVSALLKQA